MATSIVYQVASRSWRNNSVAAATTATTKRLQQGVFDSRRINIIQPCQRLSSSSSSASASSAVPSTQFPPDAALPVESFSTHEYPWATEPPVITKTTAAEAARLEELQAATVAKATARTTANDSGTNKTAQPEKDASSSKWLGGFFSSSSSSTASLDSLNSSSDSSSSISSCASTTTTLATSMVDRVVSATSSRVELDNFDDIGALSYTQRQERRVAQRQALDATLTLSTRVEPITTIVPPYIPASTLSSSSSSSPRAIPETLITTLPNGVRVVSQETYGQVSTVGIVSDFGSRYEQHNDATMGGSSTLGLAHLLELSAFGSAGTKYDSAAAVAHQLQEWGGSRYVSSGREQTVHAIDVLRPNAPFAVEMLADVVVTPHYLSHELDEAKQAIGIAASSPDHMPPELLLSEALQAAAYGTHQQLGQPYLCPVEALDNFTSSTCRSHWNTHVVSNPHGLVLGGAGMAHDELVALAETHFGHLLQTTPLTTIEPSTSATTTAAKSPRTRHGMMIPSIYQGGECKITIPIPNENNGSDPSNTDKVDPAEAILEEKLSVVSAEQRMTRLAIAVEVGGWHSPDLVAVCVLQTLLGGGSSFSAGGPGKGMYSRLYRQVLNKYRWAESTEAFTSFHNESGLMGIIGSAQAEHVPQMARVFCTHLKKLANEPVSHEELNRARNMLKNNVLTQLESRLVLFEDMARQVLTYGQRESARTTCARIEAVTATDIQDLMQRALSQAPPTIAAVGVDVSNVPTHQQVVELLR